MSVANIIRVIGIPVKVMDLSSWIIFGIWLAIIGEWTIIGTGVLLFIVTPTLVNIALLPVIVFAGISSLHQERKETVWRVIFDTLGNGYIVALMIFWCGAIMYLFTALATVDSLVPSLLWSYNFATGQWNNLATGEKEPVSIVIVGVMEFAYLLAIILILTIAIPLTRAFQILAVCMLGALLFQVIVTVWEAKELRESGEW
jgi:hypothetical protein